MNIFNKNIIIKEIGLVDLNTLKDFVFELGDTPYFTYFDKRDIENSLKNHKLTLLLKENEKSCAYAHIDYDGEYNWFGLAVLKSCRGKGYGSYLLKYAVEFADKNNMALRLMVYSKNDIAVKMYLRNGFKRLNEKEKGKIYMMRNK